MGFFNKSKRKLNKYHKEHPNNKKKDKKMRVGDQFVNDDDIHLFDHNTKHPSKKAKKLLLAIEAEMDEQGESW